jgi:hypothetical protein
MKESKTCENCGKVFYRRRRITDRRWKSQRACGSECAAKLRRYLAPLICPKCGNEFQPTTRRAKYCGRKCAADAHSGPKVVKGKRERYAREYDENGVRQLAHRLAMERKLGRKLVRGETVHHKNGDKKDNSPGNLELWYKGQPAGQRVSDLIEYVVKHHAAAARSLLSSLCGEF